MSVCLFDEIIEILQPFVKIYKRIKTSEIKEKGLSSNKLKWKNVFIEKDLSLNCFSFWNKKKVYFNFLDLKFILQHKKWFVKNLCQIKKKWKLFTETFNLYDPQNLCTEFEKPKAIHHLIQKFKFNRFA
jgi:hypothetical protein